MRVWDITTQTSIAAPLIAPGLVQALAVIRNGDHSGVGIVIAGAGTAYLTLRENGRRRA